MNINSDTVIVNKSKADVISFLTSVGNYEKLMPEETKFEVLGQTHSPSGLMADG